MLSRIRHTGNKNTKFHHLPANVEELQSGYLFKSPPQNQAHFKVLRSWKRRYFVLSRTLANVYELKFFRDENRSEKPLGQINLYRVMMFFRLPEYHPVWFWIEKNFKCPVSCVLYLQVCGREYFLIGENSDQVEDWFNQIFKVVNTLPNSKVITDLGRQRSRSVPTNVYCEQEQLKEQDGPEFLSPLLVRQSAPGSFNALNSHYDYPKNYLLLISQPQESEDSEEDKEEEMKTFNETEEKESCYMEMKSLKGILKQIQNQEDSFSQTNLEEKAAEKSILQTGNRETGSTSLIHQIPPGSEKNVCVEMDIFISQDELKNNVIFAEKEGSVCVSSCGYTQTSNLFYEGDQIRAINDLLTDSLGQLQTYLLKLTKKQVKLTILRQPGSQSSSGCCT